MSSSPGREHRDVVPELDQLLGQVADVRLHPAGDVPGVRADDADAHVRPSPPGTGRGGQVGEPEPLQHVPVGRVRGDAAAAKQSASACVAGRHPLAQRARPARSIGAPIALAPAAVVGEARVARAAARRRSSRRAAPGRRASGSARRRTSPRRRCGTDRGRRAGRRPCSRAAARPAPRSAAAAPPVSGDDLHADALAVRDEPVEHRLGLEPLGDGGERAAAVRPARRPATSQFPECGSARIDARCPRASAVVDVLARRSCCARCRPTTSAWSIVSAAGTSPASSGSTSAARRRRVRPCAVRTPSGPTTRRRFLRSCCAPPPLRTVAASAAARNARSDMPSRHRLDHAPARRVAEVDRPRSRAASSIRPRGVDGRCRPSPSTAATRWRTAARR